MRRNNVDEVLKNVESRKQPISGEIERAIIHIIGNKLERSLSAPSRMTVKSTHNVITSGFEQSRNELTITAMNADMSRPLTNDYKQLFSDDVQKVNDFVKYTTKSSKNIKVQGLIPTKSSKQGLNQGTLSKDMTRASINPSQQA